MKKGTITFRLDEEKRKALDVIASSMDRDRSYVLNDAINSYLDVYRWQLSHIKQGLSEAKAGSFASEKEVSAAFSKWRK